MTLLTVLILAGTTAASTLAQTVDKAAPWAVVFDMTNAARNVWRGRVVVDDPVLHPPQR